VGYVAWNYEFDTMRKNGPSGRNLKESASEYRWIGAERTREPVASLNEEENPLLYRESNPGHRTSRLNG
jgi:hypothetical protein